MAKCGETVAAILALLALWPATTAIAQINHCIGADGVHIYTDQGCNAVNAYRAEEVPPGFRLSPLPEPEVNTFKPPDHGCARELGDLEKRLRDAIAARDHNKLATLFHWPGASRHTADRVMPSLVRISRRPLHDVTVFTEFDDTNWRDDPVTMEIEQSEPGHPDSYLVSRFRLMKFSGCWWMSF